MADQFDRFVRIVQNLYAAQFEKKQNATNARTTQASTARETLTIVEDSWDYNNPYTPAVWGPDANAFRWGESQWG